MHLSKLQVPSDVGNHKRIDALAVTVRVRTCPPRGLRPRRHHPPATAAAGASGGFHFWGRSSSSRSLGCERIRPSTSDR